MVPRRSTFTLQKGYRTREYLQRKQMIVKKTKPWYQGNVSEVDSDSEGHDDKDYFKDIDCFFDEKELNRIQLDEVTIKRHYLRLTCLKIPNRHIDDHIMIDLDYLEGPHRDVAFQYFMDNFCIKLITSTD